MGYLIIGVKSFFTFNALFLIIFVRQQESPKDNENQVFTIMWGIVRISGRCCGDS